MDNDIEIYNVVKIINDKGSITKHGRDIVEHKNLIGKIGKVVSRFDESHNSDKCLLYGVKINGITNSNTSEGVYYFTASELELVKNKEEDKLAEFETVVKPVIEYMNKSTKINPNTKIIITPTNAELVSNVMSIKTLEYIKD